MASTRLCTSMGSGKTSSGLAASVPDAGSEVTADQQCDCWVSTQGEEKTSWNHGDSSTLWCTELAHTGSGELIIKFQSFSDPTQPLLKIILCKLASK